MINFNTERIDYLHRKLTSGQYPDHIILELRNIRKELACWLEHATTEDVLKCWNHGLGDSVQKITRSALFSITPDIQDQQFADHICNQAIKCHSISLLLSVMLYRYPFEVNHPVDLSYVPIELHRPVINWICYVPQTFSTTGDVDLYAEHVRRWSKYFYDLLSPSVPNTILNGSYIYGSQLNCIPLYFTEHSLRDVYSIRAGLLGRMLTINGHQLDYSFPEREDKRRIRYGILTRSFSGLSEVYTLFPLFEFLDRSRYEIILFVQKSVHSPLERHAQTRSDRLEILPEGLHKQVEYLRAQNCDLLLFGSNLTARLSDLLLLACFRLARVQFTNFCSPVTTGLPFMDYYLSGKLSEPDQNAYENYTEKLIHLNGPGFCFQYGLDNTPTTQTITRESLGITSEEIAFSSGANLYKILPEIMDLWARILAQVPFAKLMLFPFGGAWNAKYDKARFFNVFNGILQKHGIHPARLIIINTLPNRAAVRNFLINTDIYLDTPRHGGANSLVDPLALDIPTVVCRGTNLRAMQGVGIIRDLGLTELITDNEESYIRLAVDLAKNPNRRREISRKIRVRMCKQPSFLDPAAHAAELSKIFSKILCEKGIEINRMGMFQA